MDLYECLRLFHEISLKDFDLLTEKFRIRSFKKNDLLIVPGQVQKELYLRL